MDFLQSVLEMLLGFARSVWPGALGAATGGYIGWSMMGFPGFLIGTAIGRFVDSDFSSLEPSILENTGRTTWDARASVRVTSKVSGQLAIDNLTNRNYQEPLGYYALQRAVRVGVRVAF